MSRIVRWAKLPEDPTEADEQRLAETKGLEAMLEALPEAAEAVGATEELRALLEQEYTERLERLHSTGVEGEENAEEQESDSEGELRLRLLRVKRSAVISLRDRNEIDDTVLRHVQSHIDLEELRLTRTLGEPE
ncbi:hypothetical protein [Naasia aerilata]|uniref:Uncharacterized protein n=1 Tax=Naasia aerilata TaxID=1162966 RepID=A0ABM8GFZ3_9MICO|nr:hypothetical protein [Naasia aerilata]BDZ47245.1 hypothetical protein GCM10025866_31540 [Naasia aerilata]